MTVSETVPNVFRQLETNLLDGNYYDEKLYDLLKIVHDQLQEIEKKSNSMSIDEKQQFLFMFQSFEVNLLRQFFIQFSSKISSSFVSTLLDIIRLQLIIDMETNSLMSDCYFKISLIWLTTDSTINYLTEKKFSISNESSIDEQLFNLFCYIGSRAVYYKTSGSSSMCVSRKTTPTFFELTNTTDRLLRAFIIYLNSYFLDDRQHSESDILILKWLLNMADIYGFIPYFVNTGYPEAILEWMKKIRHAEKQISLEIWLLVINILYNFARHWIGIKVLNKLKTLTILKEWKNRYFSELPSNDMMKTFEEILVAYYLLYVLLLEPREMKKGNMTSIQTVLDHIIDRTIQAFNSSEFNCGLYNVSEYLAGLAKLVANDKFLLYIISKDNIFDLFFQKFLEFNHLCTRNSNIESNDLHGLICSSLYTIFWSISFQSDYYLKLKNNDEFIQFIEQMSKTESNNEHIVTMRRAAKGILFNLDLVQTDLQPIDNNIEIDYDHVKVMISYAHKDTKLCQQLVNKLQNRVQGDIWVDFIKLKPPYEDDWEEIACAITQCDVILMIVTENYCTSKSCRREVIHADKRNKRIIPIYQGKEYQPEDWFEIRVGSATFVRFGDNKSDEIVMETLLNLIHAKDKTKRSLNREKLHQTPTLTSQQQTIQSIVLHPILPISPVLSPTRLISNPIIDTLTIQSVSHSSTPDIIPSLTLPSVNTKPIEQWTNVDLQQLLQLPSSILDLSSGQALLAYIRLLSNEDALFDEYETCMRHRGLSREQFANLIGSLISLRSLYNIEETSNLSPDQWTYEEIKCWFRQNRLSDYLFDTFTFVDGTEFLIYAKLVTESSIRMDAEYDRLRSRIQSRNNGQDIFQLDEYARFINALKKLLIRFQSSSSSNTTQESAQCTIS
ncbi:unnamed protein product [Rotaria sordida]|uniref:TIR domain-containing protein n=1 Tax=Rotaria sordida TaxID=392033 RepID=A0A819M873_9BILA|nr:unnamed protein product [Rotaria sordida]